MKKHFFKTFEFEFETQRLLWYCPAGGSDYAEVAATTEKIKDGNYESWFQQWNHLAEKIEKRGDDFHVNQTKGNAYLRASRYYQAAEFFLNPQDLRKLMMYEKSVSLFHQGLAQKGINYIVHEIPYKDITLRSFYFLTSATKSKGTIYICGGFDALLEELYFTSTKYLLENGYDVILYEGPGQSHIIRFEKTPFETDWNLVVAAVKSFYQNNYNLSAYSIGIGVSLGGLLLSRSASLDQQLFDKVIFYDYFPSMHESIKVNIPKFLQHYMERGFPTFLEKIISRFMATQPFLNWQIEHAKWVFGANTLNELLDITKDFNENIAYEQLMTDCLILVGENDNYYDSKLATAFYQKIPSPNKKIINFNKTEFATDLHCQNGSGYDANDQIIEWIHQQ